MGELLADFIRRRAFGHCEYCRFPERFSETPFQVDHIIARKHGGVTEPGNLALACFYCNNAKGPDIASIDPETRGIVRLFHPRNDTWAEHFHWKLTTLRGRTAIGRATIALLQINRPDSLDLRRSLQLEGDFPF